MKKFRRYLIRREFKSMDTADSSLKKFRKYLIHRKFNTVDMAGSSVSVAVWLSCDSLFAGLIAGVLFAATSVIMENWEIISDVNA